MSEAPNRIKQLRMAAEPRLSQQALGDRIGVSKMTISDLERGNMELTVDYMRRIASSLGVRPTDLLLEQDNPEALDAEERRIIELYRAASAEEQLRLQRLVEVVFEPREKRVA